MSKLLKLVAYKFCPPILAAALGLALISGHAIAQDDDGYDFDHVSCQGGANEIRIIITDVKKSAGLITADLYPNKQDGFLKGTGRLKRATYAAKSPTTSFCMAAPEAGDFSISIFQDKNANGIFDKGAFGIPVEPWGLSNDPKVRFSAPPIEKTLFPVDQSGAKVKIKLN